MTNVMNLARPTYPLKAITAISGYENGRLPDSVMHFGPRGMKLNVVSAPKFDVLVQLGLHEGIALTTTGDYRSFDQQVNLQDQRYDKGYIPGRKDYNFYQGQWYSLKIGASMASVPGNSNHGKGRSRDWAIQKNGVIVSLDVVAKNFLAVNAPKCGIFFEVDSEDWHGTDYAGDDLPDFVKYYYGSPETPPAIPVFNPSAGSFSLYPFDKSKATLRYIIDPHMHSDLVAYLQGVLRVRLGYAVAVDGDFGEQTRDFVIWFQASHGLQADGIVGPKTWAVIDQIAG